MAVKRWIKLNKINGVAAGGTATIDLPTDKRYHAIYLEYNTSTAGGPTEANMEAELTEMRINIDGVTQRRCSCAQLFDINRTKGKAPVVGSSNGYAIFYFSEPQRKSHIGREATAWGMKGVNSFQMEVDIASGATSPVITGWALVDDVQEAPLGIVKWKRETIQVSATGELTHSLDTGRGESYQGVFLFENTAGDIDNARLLWDGTEMYNGDENVQAALSGSSDFTAVSKLFHLPLDYNNPADAVPMVYRDRAGNDRRVQELLLTLTMGGANNVTAIREVVGTPD